MMPQLYKQAKTNSFVSNTTMSICIWRLMPAEAICGLIKITACMFGTGPVNWDRQNI